MRGRPGEYTLLSAFILVIKVCGGVPALDANDDSQVQGQLRNNILSCHMAYQINAQSSPGLNVLEARMRAVIMTVSILNRS